MTRAIVLLRNDLRLQDNPALYFAAKENQAVIALYIEDKTLGPSQKWWVSQSLKSFLSSIQDKLCYRSGEAKTVIKQLAKEHKITRLYLNNDKELKIPGLEIFSYNGSLLLEPYEMEKPYLVFTPFWKKALQTIEIPKSLPKPNIATLIKVRSDPLPKAVAPDPLFDSFWQPGEQEAQKRLKQFVSKKLASYQSARDFPMQEGTSRLSAHLHFGEVGPRQIWRAVSGKSAASFLSEIGWREFCYHLFSRFPKLQTEPLNERYKKIPWEKNQAALHAWQEGKTGYPIVDAGMRELKHTGWMHNRVRMIVASFLIKDLLIDWREGEKWFWKHLVDADRANNGANWQWVAGCGADAAPYFRIFNPVTQGKKFDPEGIYIRTWCPEYTNHEPVDPIVDHAEAREKTLKLFKQSLKVKL